MDDNILGAEGARALSDNKRISEESVQWNMFVPLSVLNYRRQFTTFLSKCVIESLFVDSYGKYKNEFERVLYSYGDSEIVETLIAKEANIDIMSNIYHS